MQRFLTHPYVLLTLAPLFWAGNIVLARGITGLVPPVALSFWRWALATVLIVALNWRAAGRDRPLLRRHWRRLLLLAFLGVSSFGTLLYLAVQTTTAINGSLMQTTLPSLVVALSFVLYRDRIRPIQAVAVFVAIAGAVVLVARGSLHTLLTLTFVPGDLLIFLAVVLYALYTVLLRRRPAIPEPSFLVYTFALGTLLLLPFYLLERAGGARTPLTLPVVSSLLYLALFPSIVAYYCWNRGTALIGPNRAGLFINLLPVFAAALSILFLGESVRPYHLLGMVLVSGGVVLFNRTRVAQATKSPVPSDTGL